MAHVGVEDHSRSADNAYPEPIAGGVCTCERSAAALPAVWAAVDFEPLAGCDRPDVFVPFGNPVEIRRPARESIS